MPPSGHSHSSHSSRSHSSHHVSHHSHTSHSSHYSHSSVRSGSRRTVHAGSSGIFSKPRTNQPVNCGKNIVRTRYKGSMHEYIKYDQGWTDPASGLEYPAGYYDENGNFYKDVAFLDGEGLFTADCECEYCGTRAKVRWKVEVCPSCPNCGAALNFVNIPTDKLLMPPKVIEEETGRSGLSKSALTTIRVTVLAVLACGLLSFLGVVIPVVMFLNSTDEDVSVAEADDDEDDSDGAGNDEKGSDASGSNSSGNSETSGSSGNGSSETSSSSGGGSNSLLSGAADSDASGSLLGIASGNPMDADEDYEANPLSNVEIFGKKLRLDKISDQEYRIREDGEKGDKVLTWDYGSEAYYDKNSDCYLWYDVEVSPNLWQYWYEDVSSDYGDYGWMEYEDLTDDGVDNGIWYIETEDSGWVKLPSKYDTSKLWHIAEDD